MELSEHTSHGNPHSLVQQNSTHGCIGKQYTRPQFGSTEQRAWPQEKQNVSRSEQGTLTRWFRSAFYAT